MDTDERIHWSDVDFTDGEIVWSARQLLAMPAGARALREFRATDAMRGYWPRYPGTAADIGRDDIDWTGFP